MSIGSGAAATLRLSPDLPEDVEKIIMALFDGDGAYEDVVNEHPESFKHAFFQQEGWFNLINSYTSYFPDWERSWFDFDLDNDCWVVNFSASQIDNNMATIMKEFLDWLSEWILNRDMTIAITGDDCAEEYYTEFVINSNGCITSYARYQKGLCIDHEPPYAFIEQLNEVRKQNGNRIC